MNSKVFFLVCICVIACKHAVSASWDQPQGYWTPGSQGASETICSNHRSVAYISPFTSKTHCHPCSTLRTPCQGTCWESIPTVSSSACDKFLPYTGPKSPKFYPKETPSLSLQERPLAISRVWGLSCVPYALYPRPKQPRFLPFRQHTRPGIWSA